MNIAMVCPHYGYIKRGTENTTAQISKRLNHNVRIISLSTLPGLRKDRGLGKLSDSFFEKTLLGGFSRRWLGFNPNIEDISFAKKAYNKIKWNIDEYDLLWSNGEYWCAKAITKLGKKYNKPTVLFFGGGISEMMYKEAKLLPDLFVVLTPEMEKQIKKYVPKCNVKCIPCGADLEKFKPTKKFKKYSHPIVVSTAAMIKDKRIKLIVDAMDELGKGTLFTTNTGPLEKEIVSYANKKLGKRYHHFGVIDYNKLPLFYGRANVMVLASDHEPFGMTIIESMACNTPVVVQRDRTRVWMIGNGGVVVKDITKKESLVGAIELAYKHRFRNAPRKMAERFSWDNIAKQYEESINELCS